jgi:hypothetical protein
LVVEPPTEDIMPDSSKPSRSTPNPVELPEDLPDASESIEVPVEGPLPGLPVATDPLLQPSPRPQKREVPRD